MLIKNNLFRDFGENLRIRVKELANPLNITGETAEALSKQIDSLEKLTNNTYAKKYKRIHSSTATGLTSEQCSLVLSTEFLSYLNEEKSPKRRT